MKKANEGLHLTLALKITLLGLALTVSITTVHSTFASTSVGTAILVKGNAKQIIEGQTSWIKEGDPVFQGAIMSTDPNSTVKILFLDQTTASLGPSSSLKVDEIHSQEAGSVTVLNGQLRSKVVKNLLANQSYSKKIKFMIRTKSAVMGVRGTDFEVIYNSSNQVTSLLTFEGAVAMIKIDPNAKNRNHKKGSNEDFWSTDQTDDIVSQLTSSRAALVTEGKFSTVNPTMTEVSAPVKISPAQFETLKRADPAAVNKAPVPVTSQGGAPSKYISPIPPGLDPKTVASSPIEDKGGKGPSGISPVGPDTGFSAPSRGTGPAPGGLLDTKTGLYIPPPAGSAYDAHLDVYVAPATTGKFDAVSGSYIPPEGLKLDPNKGFVPTSNPLKPLTPSTPATAANPAKDPRQPLLGPNLPKDPRQPIDPNQPLNQPRDPRQPVAVGPSPITPTLPATTAPYEYPVSLLPKSPVFVAPAFIPPPGFVPPSLAGTDPGCPLCLPPPPPHQHNAKHLDKA